MAKLDMEPTHVLEDRLEAWLHTLETGKPKIALPIADRAILALRLELKKRKEEREDGESL